MKKILNEPFSYVDEMLEGLCAAHPQHYRQAGEDGRVIARPGGATPGKVGIVTGGGSGRLPVFTGYVGQGLLDACAIGDVFSSPNVEQMVEAIRQANGGSGVLCLFGNYGGDVMNFDMAAELADMEGIQVKTVLVKDDVASAPPAEAGRRRGVAGMVFAFKVAGAKADKGGSLDEVAAAAEKALANIRTMGVALSPCTVPLAGKPTFTIGDDEMEIGMGIHGEPGMKREKLQTADQIAERMTLAILEDLPQKQGTRVAVMVNGLGATPPEELYVIYRKVDEILKGKGLVIHRAYVGEFATSMEMAGASLTFMYLDDELAELLDAPAHTPFFKQF